MKARILFEIPLRNYVKRSLHLFLLSPEKAPRTNRITYLYSNNVYTVTSFVRFIW